MSRPIARSEQFRSADYRKKYFHKHPGYFGLYCCAYCGRLMEDRTATVDHIVPVNAVARSRIIRLLYHGRQDGINTLHNLTTACGKCNSTKGSKLGLWILRGWIGRRVFPLLWILLLALGPKFLSYTVAVILIAAGKI